MDTQLLVNQGSDLYLAGRQTRRPCKNWLPISTLTVQTGAAWLPDGKSVVMILEREGRGIWQMAVDSGSAQRLTPKEMAHG